MTDPHPTDEPSAATSRRRIPTLAIAAGALILGAIASTSTMLIAGYRYTPEREFTVAVHLLPDADDRQRAAVEKALARLPARDGVRLETRQEAYEKLRARSAGPEQMEGVEADSLPESLHLTTVGRDFDCAPIPRIRKLDGVDRVRVVLRPLPGRPGAELGC